MLRVASASLDVCLLSVSLSVLCATTCTLVVVLCPFLYGFHVAHILVCVGNDPSLSTFCHAFVLSYIVQHSVAGVCRFLFFSAPVSTVLLLLIIILIILCCARFRVAIYEPNLFSLRPLPPAVWVCCGDVTDRMAGFAVQLT